MYERGVQSVLRCKQCNKPFDKESTLKRHGYYCRSRTTGATIRSRSCISCAKAKTRCDNQRPECSRCLNKAIECHYRANTPKTPRPKVQPNDDAPRKQPKRAPSLVSDSPNVEIHQESRNDGVTSFDNALAISGPEIANIGADYLDWNGPDASFIDFLNPQTNYDIFQYPSPESLSIFQPATISSPSISISSPPTSMIRSLVQRPRMKTGAQRIANLILHTLKSYPLMMLRDNALPPFIHSSVVSSHVDNKHMEPLTNCISLVHMISSTVGSRKLFWKNVRLECERLCAEHLRLNKSELLAALQASLLYILIRLDEGETDHNNFDFLLLSTVTVVSKQLARPDIISNTHSVQCKCSLETKWKDWIFEESKRRLCVVYQVMNMLVYFEPAAMCDLHEMELVVSPLPAKKQLWEAVDESVWMAESDRDPDFQTAFGLAANGELVKLDESQIYCSDEVLLLKPIDSRTPSRSTAQWEEWCAGMDGFGGLVMLAASLIV